MTPFPPDQPINQNDTNYLPPPPAAPNFGATDPQIPVAVYDDQPYAPSPAPATTRPRGPRWLLIILAALVVVVVGAAIAFAARGAFGALGAKGSTTPGAVTAARAYCQDLTKANYPAAFGLFTPALQQALPQNAYRAAATLLDAQNGTVTACQPATTANLSADGKTATVMTSVTRLHQPATSLALTFALTGQAWDISQVPDPAVPPIATGYGFCQALIASNPAAAYALISTSFQQAVGTEAQFAATLQQVESVTGAVQSCALQQWQLKSDGHSGTISLGTSFANFQDVPSQFAMTLDATGAWKVNTVSLQLLGSPVTLPLNLTGN